MRFSVFAILVTLFAQVPQTPATFPIPKDMHEIWPGAKLSDTDKQLLRKAVNADLRLFNEQYQSAYTFESVDTADIDLGTLGKGVIVVLSESPECGTGGCPIYAYVREEARYRRVLGAKPSFALGWAFAVVKSNGAIPDLVTASHLSGDVVTLIMYRYDGSTFTRQGCENLTPKNSNATLTSWWDSSQLNVEPCAQH